MFPNTRAVYWRVGFVCCIASLAYSAEPPANSALWGIAGERWGGPNERLPDWSYAGYRGYEAQPPEIPLAPVWKNITQAPYNADNTGTRDVSDIIIRAIRDYRPGSSPKALYFPEGTYRVSKYIKIDKGNLVLRGAGMGRSILRFSQGLLACDINLMESYTGPGMIHFTGGNYCIDELQDDETLDMNHRKVGVVTAALKRGERNIPVSSTSGLTAGDWVMLQWDHEPGAEDEQYSLEYRKDLWDEYLNHSPGNTEHPYRYFQAGLMVWIAKIETISAHQITLVRGLPFKTKPKHGAKGWDTVVRKLNTNVFLTGVGVEDLTIDFPGFVEQRNRNGKPGFTHNERIYRDSRGNNHASDGPGRQWFLDFRDGHDAVALYSVIDSWIRRVEFVDCDGPVILENARHVTVRDLVMKKADKRGAPMGHFGVRMSHYSHDVLLENIAFDGADYVHDLGTQICHHCVYSNCSSRHDMECDMHGHAYACLYTQIRTTKGDIHAGNTLKKPNGAFNTFWNLSTENGTYSNRNGDFFGIRKLSGNLIGVNSGAIGSVNSDPTGARSELWVEKWNGPDTIPRNLYHAQRKRRIDAR